MLNILSANHFKLKKVESMKYILEKDNLNG